MAKRALLAASLLFFHPRAFAQDVSGPSSFEKDVRAAEDQLLARFESAREPVDLAALRAEFAALQSPTAAQAQAWQEVQDRVSALQDFRARFAGASAKAGAGLTDAVAATARRLTPQGLAPEQVKAVARRYLRGGALGDASGRLDAVDGDARLPGTFGFAADGSIPRPDGDSAVPTAGAGVNGPAGQSVVNTALVVYPGPAGVAPSSHYRVQVCQGSRCQSSFVYQMDAQKTEAQRGRSTTWNREDSTSFTSFSFSGPVTVKVTKLDGDFDSSSVLPAVRGIKPQRIAPDAVAFKVDKPGQFSVEFGDEPKNPMLVFANPLEKNVPKPGAPGVVYFGPGVHDIGADFPIPSNATVYLAGGAYVRGTFAAGNVHDVTIRGRGVLSGELIPHFHEDFKDGVSLNNDPIHNMIDVKDWHSQRVSVEGITLVDAPRYNINLHGSHNEVRNVKVLGSWANTDGVQVGDYGEVADSFFSVNDDTVKLNNSHARYHGLTIWQKENGAPFQFSWNTSRDVADVRIEDCDVIHVDHDWQRKWTPKWKPEWASNNAVFDAVHGGQGHLSDIQVDNIRVENGAWRLFNLTVAKNDWSKGEPTGSISDVTFSRISVAGQPTVPNSLRGARPGDLSGFTFKDVTVGGHPWTSLQDANFNANTADGVRVIGPTR